MTLHVSILIIYHFDARKISRTSIGDLLWRNAVPPCAAPKLLRRVILAASPAHVPACTPKIFEQGVCAGRPASGAQIASNPPDALYSTLRQTTVAIGP